MNDYQTQLTKNHIGHLMPDLEEIGIQKIAKDAIKKCIWNLANKLCEQNVNYVNEVNDDEERNGNK